MKKIAITGNIASGKSQVEKILADLNYTIFDTDKINNELLINDDSIKKEIFNAFKNFDIEENGKISKQKLANIVFNDKEKKEILEKILHKKIFEKIKEYEKKNNDKDFIFISVPLLFEANWQNYFDKILFISAKENIRLDRLIKRNNLTKEQATSRINSQEKEENKIAKSDFVIYNNSDFATLKLQVNQFINQIINQ